MSTHVSYSPEKACPPDKASGRDKTILALLARVVSVFGFGILFLFVIRIALYGPSALAAQDLIYVVILGLLVACKFYDVAASSEPDGLRPFWRFAAIAIVAGLALWGGAHWIASALGK